MGKISKLIERIEKHRTTSMLVTLAVLLCFESVIFELVKRDTKKRHLETIDSIASSVNYNSGEVYKMLQSAVENNNNLSDEEKSAILDHIDIFSLNKDYIDVKYLVDRLSTLKISYSTENKQSGGVFISSWNNYLKNEITFFGVSSIEEVKHSIFTHELFHVMQKHYNMSFSSYLIDKNFNGFLAETINTVFNEENILEYEGSIYAEMYNFLKMIIEIIGPEPVKKYQGYNDSYIIIESLMEVIDDKKYAEELLSILDDYKSLYEKITNDNSDKDNARKSKLEKLKRSIIERISVYYEAKFGFSMEDDLVMLYYCNPKKFDEEFKNNICGIDRFEFLGIDNDIRYFDQNGESNLTIYVKRPVRKKQVVIDEHGQLVIQCDSVEEEYFVYVISSENRYINKDVSMKKSIS